MDVLRFTLSGEQAFFKKPEVNSYYYFTYGNIHRVALLGLFGAILGYGGYAQQAREKEPAAFPEFYERLHNIHISMIPIALKGCFPRKIVAFNNSVGYASREQGGNLIVKQQWLENPKWYVYVQLDSEEAKKIADYIIHKKCVYLPYLGSNDHPADITEAAVLSIEKNEMPQHIDSLFEKEKICIDIEDWEQDNPFRYEEILPCALDSELNQYLFKKYVLTNMAVLETKCDVYTVNDIDGASYQIAFE